MKKLLISLIISSIGIFQWYPAQTHLVGKSFRAVIGSVCAETDKPDPCAGHMIYLVMNFRSNDVLLTEKEANTCKETITSRVKAKWKSGPDGKILLSYTSRLPEESFLEGLHLQLKKNKLIAYKKDWQGQMVEYEFETFK